MIDSVLKGTGNSRFLKSAVPAGTSWTDALAMLQAGTFPIDLNGINTEGFQQVGTPLNKANLLKDATAAQIGLPPSTTPDGMFQALGNTGDLHVWRKTVTTAQEIPAGYNLVPVDMKTTTFMYLGNNISSSSSPELYYGESANVNPDGSVSVSAVGKLRGQIGWNTTSDAVVMKLFPSDTNSSMAITSSSELQSLLRGKFVYFIENKNSWSAPSYLSSDKFYQIPSNATITFRSGYSTEGNPSVIISISSVNEVVGYPLTPAGTTTTYPVSTNPNAYQEGDDAKEAVYVVGEVVSGSYLLGSANSGQNYYYKTATSLSVSDDGTLSMPSNAEQVNLVYSANGLTTDHIKSSFAGKFVQLSSTGADLYYNSLFKTKPSEILFIPREAIITKGNDKCFYIDRYQPVTGYAAIPAGTTIEYLGKLGDKAMVQVVSYVGTGTYGSSNPNSLTFDFVPKFCVFTGDDVAVPYLWTPGTTLHAVYLSEGGSSVGTTYNWTVNTVWDSASKKIQWHSTSNAKYQYNTSGKKYRVIAIG